MLDFTRPVQTTAGHPVRILTTEGLGHYPVIGVVNLNGREVEMRWTRGGAPQYEHQTLVNVPRPYCHTIYLNVDAAGVCTLFYTRRAADHGRLPGTIACHEVTIEGREGDGL